MRPAKRMHSHAKVLGALLTFVTACGETTRSSCDGAISEAIVGGTSEPTLVALSNEQVRSIVSLVIPVDSRTASWPTCSGVVVAQDIVLTARHCFEREDDDEGESARRALDTTVTAGATSDAPAAIGAVDSIVFHMALDVALLHLRWPIDEAPPLTPIPLIPRLDVSWVGHPVELSGYGATGLPEPPSLRFGVELVERLEADHIVVDGHGSRGACVGDSGGPLLGRGEDGRLNVLGLLDHGDASCTGEDSFTRADRIHEWSDLSERLSMAPEPTAACDGLVHAGICERGRAMWCESSSAHTDDCQARGLVCGWSNAVLGFRCVERADDACAGVGSYRQCQGNVLVSCTEGALLTQACESCGQSCRDWTTGAGAGCL